MTLPIGAHVLVGPNPIWPRLAGKTGIVVHVTKAAKCYGANGCERAKGCGNNVIVEMAGMGRFLLSPTCVAVVEDVEVTI
jgi:hypothetical protein